MSTADSDSDDENIAMLREAADTTFISDGMFNKDANRDPSTSISTPTASKKRKPSQRFIAMEDHDTDLKVTETMQNYVYKKLSKLIDESVEFVDVEPARKEQRLPSCSEPTIKLLKDTEPINLDAASVEPDVIKQVKPKITRRTLEPDGLSEAAKVDMAAIDVNRVTECTKLWKEKKGKDRKLFKYKEKKSILYQIEPENEFSKQRKKNNWCETKIAKYKQTSK